MRLVLSLPWAALVLAAGPLFAAERTYEIELLLAAGTPRPQAAEVVATRVDAPEAARRAGLVGAPTANLTLPRSGVWEIRAVAPGLWSSRTTVRPGALGGPERVKLLVARQAAVTGALVLSPAQESPAELTLHLFADDRRGDPRGPSLSSPCVRQQAEFRCDAPAGLWDLRLAAKGFVAHYQLRKQLLPARDNKLGKIQLVRGASVSGLVRDPGSGPAAGVDVSLQPLRLEPGPGAEQTQERTTLNTTTDRNGFFQLHSLPPGLYQLRASGPGGSAAQFSPVRVVVGAESMLERPLTLEKQVSVAVSVTPLHDSGGAPWRLTLLKIDRLSDHAHAAVDEAELASGSGLVGPLAPGTYSALVTDAAGEFRLAREVTIDEVGSPLQLDLELVEVSGRILLGSEPIAAEAWFGGRQGLESVRQQSDEDGWFSGLLPNQATWPTVDVEAVEPAVQTRLTRVRMHRNRSSGKLEVELRLPLGVVSGRVVDARGKAASGAVVLLEDSLDWRLRLELRANERGRFRAAGLPEDPFVVTARSSAGSSRPQHVDVTDDPRSQELRLVIEERREIEGRVFGPSGGVIGAQVFVTDGGGLIEASTTREDGSFRVSWPRAAAAAAAVVLPPGYSLTVFPLPPPSHGPVDLAVSGGGGTLRLDSTSPDAAVASEGGRELVPVLLAQGIALPIQVLRTWALANGGEPGDGGPLVVPRVAAGRFDFCQADASKLIGQPLAAALRNCQSGVLADGAELALRPTG